MADFDRLIRAQQELRADLSSSKAYSIILTSGDKITGTVKGIDGPTGIIAVLPVNPLVGSVAHIASDAIIAMIEV